MIAKRAMGITCKYVAYVIDPITWKSGTISCRLTTLRKFEQDNIKYSKTNAKATAETKLNRLCSEEKTVEM